MCIRDRTGFGDMGHFLKGFDAVLHQLLCVNAHPVSYTHLDVYKRQEYMGHTVNFRSSKKSYRDKRVKNAPEDWLIFENTHEALSLIHI